MKVALISLEERAIEWFCALCTVWVGLCLLMPGDMVALSRFAGLARYGLAEDTLGTIAVGCGFARLAALYVNGRKAVTPYFRVGFAWCGFLLWAPLASASFEAAMAHPSGFFRGITSVGAGGGMYALTAIFEIFSVYRAMSDSRYLSPEHGVDHVVK